jgi:hypothetical protein
MLASHEESRMALAPRGLRLTPVQKDDVEVRIGLGRTVVSETEKIDSVSESRIKRTCGSTNRQCDRTLGAHDRQLRVRALDEARRDEDDGGDKQDVPRAGE